MTTRRFLLIATLLLTSCGSRKPSTFEMPAAVAEWSRSSDTRAAPADTKAVAAWSASYTGTPQIEVTIHEMSSTTLAFDKVQSWRGETGKLAFYHGRYFGLAESPGADQRTLNRFATAFVKLLKSE